MSFIPGISSTEKKKIIKKQVMMEKDNIHAYAKRQKKMAWGVLKDHKSVRLQGSVYFAVF